MTIAPSCSDPRGLLTSGRPVDGRRDRLVKVQNANAAAPADEPRFTGWCLDKEDLCAAKLCAFREKGRNFGSLSGLERVCLPTTERSQCPSDGGGPL